MIPSTPPRWELSNVYPGLESKEFTAASARFKEQITDLRKYFAAHIAAEEAKTDPAKLAEIASGAIERLNAALELGGTLQAYLFAFFTTDSHNTTAKRLLSEFEQVWVNLRKLDVQLKGWAGRAAPLLPAIFKHGGAAQAHAFMLQEAAEQSKYLMSAAEENLAAELNLSGANAWGKLQGIVTSQLTVDFELDGKTQKLPLAALVNLRSHADESVRRRAYEAELQACESLGEPLAACLNGIKGEVITLNRRRGRSDAIHAAIDQARIDRPTLETLLAAMQDSFPMFRRYFKAKAKRLGKEKLAWWDICAPLGNINKRYTFEEAGDFILENFGTFSAELEAFARRAFENHWIDAEQREGKQGGAFCMGVPVVKESRVLCNFDGSLEQVTTIAHELGHGFHNECAYQAGKSELQQATPMTLAETASIMCETIVTEAVLEQASDAQERLAIIEITLTGAAQVIVDIYSRYLFEKEIFERREQAELSADDYCEIMGRAQQAAYGDGLDERYLHKYMWTWKPHYYDAGLSFYNFPYAFGLLFGTGLYAIYQQRGAAFIADYKNLLAATGEGKAADLAARFGIDIRSKKFWEDSLKVIGRRIERYVEL